MRASTLIAAVVAPLAVAAFDSKICKGAGGCVQVSTFPDGDPQDKFKCPSGKTLTLQKYASAAVDMTNGNYEPTSAAPASCDSGAKPSGAQAVKHVVDGLTFWGYLTETCTSAKGTFEAGDCYNANPNPSRLNVCRVSEGSTTEFCKL